MDGKEEGPSTIKINKNCTSCSGQLPFMKKAFKMACLAYEPSPVTLYDELVSRDELLDRRAEIM